MTTEEINSLLDKRDTLLKKDSNDKEADLIQGKIQLEIRKRFKDLEVDFIIETLTRFGDAPCIVYDDNGLFAVSGSGYQEVVYGKKKLEGQIAIFVEKKMWKKTIREALKYYLK